VGGDVLKFVMEIDGLTFPEALQLLAERHGIPMPKRSSFDDAESKLRGALLDMHAIAAKQFAETLRGPQGGEARAYLAKRGVDQDMIETFGLGFSEASGQALLRRLTDERYSNHELEASGLVRKRNDGSGFFDSFRGRLMFPIHNESGKVIAFGGRAMRDEDQPKYLNSPETPVYRKTSVLYNLHRARDAMRKSGRVVLVEGYMDVIGVWAAGVKEAVASCGTALTEAQVRSLHRHADTVVVNFDPDTAGANAAERALQLLLDEGLHVRVLALDGGLDPDEYVKQKGADAYRAKLDSAGGYFHWLADRARARFDMRSSEGRVDAFKFLLPSIQRISDKLERAAIANDVAGYLGVDAGLVLEQFKRSATDRRPAPPRNGARTVIPGMERMLLSALLSSAEARDEVLPRLSSEMIAGFLTREVFEVLLQMWSPGAAVTLSLLDARLEGPAQALLHEIATADEIGDENQTLEQARACLRRLEEAEKQKRIEELRSRIQTAEREGNWQSAVELAGELGRLQKRASGTA
jgi:DNA primase